MNSNNNNNNSAIDWNEVAKSNKGTRTSDNQPCGNIIAEQYDRQIRKRIHGLQHKTSFCLNMMTISHIPKKKFILTSSSKMFFHC